MNSKSKYSTLLLGIGLIVLAVVVVLYGNTVNDTYKNNRGNRALAAVFADKGIELDDAFIESQKGRALADILEENGIKLDQQPLLSTQDISAINDLLAKENIDLNDVKLRSGIPTAVRVPFTGNTQVSMLAWILTGLLLAGGAALIVIGAVNKQQKLLTTGIFVLAAALLVFFTSLVIYRQINNQQILNQQKKSFDYNLCLHLLIAAMLIAYGAIKKKWKLLIGGGILIAVSVVLKILGANLYPAAEYTRRLNETVDGFGFNFRFFYMNPPLYISVNAIGWFFGILLGILGVTMLFSYIMGTLGLRASRITTNTFIYILLVAMSIIWLIPFVCILLQSFRVENHTIVGYVIPQQWGFNNYTELFTETNFPRWYLNTFIISLVVAVVQTIIVLCMSYTLSRFRFKIRNGLMRFMLILGMFPGMLAMIILYRVLADLGLTQEHAVPGLILVYVASSGMGYYVSKGFFDTLPKSLDEAARVDGATRFQVLYKIILPLSKPIVIYTVLTAFMGPWGDYVFARYISMNEPLGMNAAVGLWSWLQADQFDQHYTHFCAGGVLVAVPVTILFMCLQRYYVEGVTGGAVKG